MPNITEDEADRAHLALKHGLRDGQIDAVMKYVERRSRSDLNVINFATN